MEQLYNYLAPLSLSLRFYTFPCANPVNILQATSMNPFTANINDTLGFKKHLLCAICMHAGMPRTTLCIWRPEDSMWKSLLSFHCAALRDQTQVVRVDSK